MQLPINKGKKHGGLLNPSARHKQKKPPFQAVFICGGRAGIRTLDPLIKSQLLYQLSYASNVSEFYMLFLLNASFYQKNHAIQIISLTLGNQT